MKVQTFSLWVEWNENGVTYVDLFHNLSRTAIDFYKKHLSETREIVCFTVKPELL